MTEKEYRTHPAISRSELWSVIESAEKFKYFKEHPQPPSSDLVFGQYLHKLILQPETLNDEFAVIPNIARNTSAGKAAYAEFVEKEFGKVLVTDKEATKAIEMRDALMANPLVSPLLLGEYEKAFFWTDEDTGEQCKCRLDVLTEDENGYPLIVDYKTTSSAKPDVFNYAIFKYGYHLQAAMYSEGVMKALSLPERPGFAFIAQEKKPPYAANIVVVTPEVMTAGVDMFRFGIGKYHDCKETGCWYGYNGPFGDMNETYLPGYMTLGDKEDDE